MRKLQDLSSPATAVKWSITKILIINTLYFIITIMMAGILWLNVRFGKFDTSTVLTFLFLFPVVSLMGLYSVHLLLISTRLMWKIKREKYQILISDDYNIVRDTDGNIFIGSDGSIMRFIGQPPFDVIVFYRYFVLHSRNDDSCYVNDLTKLPRMRVVMDWILGRRFILPIMYARDRARVVRGLTDAGHHRAVPPNSPNGCMD